MKSSSWMGRTTITICDHKWTIYFLDNKQYKKRGPEGSRAYTFAQGPRREIAFDCSRTHPGDGVVIHELVHAYSNELMGHDLEMTSGPREEFFCTLFETRGPAILKQARPLYQMLQRHSKKAQIKPEEEDEDE